MVSFKGRGFHSAVVKLMPQSDGLIVRVDCDENPEVWVEFWFPHAEMVRLTHAVEHQRWQEMLEVAEMEQIFRSEPAAGGDSQK